MACSDGVEQCIFLMRHGERQDGVDRNWKKTALRPYDTPLSQHAHYETPKLIKERLTGKGISVVISSPFLRCLQTATHAYTVLGLDGLHTCNQLSEFFALESSMMSPPSVPVLDDAEGTVVLSLDSDPLPNFPETREQCFRRYRQAVDSLADKYWPQNLLLVTHQYCVQEAMAWGGKTEDVEATYCAHVQLSRTSKENHKWVWREDKGVYAYDTVIE